jgi:predicted nucleic acid-binding protein
VILYADTSALVKRYVEEPDSEEVRVLVRRADTVATSLIAYAEARAAFARLLREGELTRDGYRDVLTEFEVDWGFYLARDVTLSTVRLAGALAEKHALRGFDAVHLATAVELRDTLQSDIAFAAADGRLAQAARAEGLS